MLVIKRAMGERIVISVGDDHLFMTPLRTSKYGTVVRIGFTGSEQISVWREEIWKAMQEHRSSDVLRTNKAE